MKELLARMRRNRAGMARLLLASLSVNLLATASSLYVTNVLNRYVAHGVSGTLVTLTLGVVLAIIGEYAFRAMRLRLAEELAGDEESRIVIGLYGLLLTAPVEQLRGRSSAEIESILHGVDRDTQAFGPANIAALSDLPFVLLFIFVIALLSPLLAGATGLVIFMLGWSGWYGQQRLTVPVQQRQALIARLSTLLTTALQAADGIRHFGGQTSLLRRWIAVVEEASAVRRTIVYQNSAIVSLTQAIHALGGVAVTTVGALLIVDGRLDVGSLIGANILANRAFATISRLSHLAEAIKKAEMALVNARAFAAAVQAEPEPGSSPAHCRGHLELCQLGIQWTDRPTPLIHSLSVTIAPGSVCVITGANGSGKSTLLRTVIGLQQPSRGQVLLDGVDVRQLAPEWRRRHLGYLPQHITFIPGTLRDNFLAVASQLSEEEMRHLIVMAGAELLITEHPAGLDRWLSHDGQEIAPGMRRRLALARAIAADAQIMLFDEPSEGLDQRGTAAVYALLINLAKRGKTLLIASHDANIVRGASQVVEL
ncbi:MAG: ATP-binding cassette domain-containing protein [Magnetococcales bacterium]|nr:ATP-binding cassette domain-containing protein [Magnetococcales bacterium]